MSIPTIEAYSPSSIKLPDNKLDWEIDWSRAAVLVHDVQYFFLRPFPKATAQELLANIEHVCTAAKARNVPIIYSVQPGGMTRLERGLLHGLWGKGMSDERDDSDIPEQLWSNYPGQKIVKWRYSAFSGTNLSMVLGSLQRSQLVVTGVYAHLGVWATTMDAFGGNIEPVVVSDAIADFTADRHSRALDLIASSCARVLSSREVVGT